MAAQAYLRTMRARPLGDAVLASGRILQPFSRAGLEAADNLLDKARRALGEGNADRATTLVRRAAALPFDEHEETAPAALRGHMTLFMLVTDELEESGKDESEWLDAALTVLASTENTARFVMRDVLVAIDQDYHLSGQEQRRLRAAIARIPPRAELRNLRLSDQELGEHLMDLLRACNAYDAALDDLLG